jgi:hypothetical protein
MVIEFHKVTEYCTIMTESVCVRDSSTTYKGSGFEYALSFTFS